MAKFEHTYIWGTDDLEDPFSVGGIPGKHEIKISYSPNELDEKRGHLVAAGLTLLMRGLARTPEEFAESQRRMIMFLTPEARTLIELIMEKK